MSTRNNKKSSSSHLIGGFLGGLTSSVILQPLDLLKTRIQQNKSSTFVSSVREIKNPLELWRGTLPSALRTSIGSALYLTSLNLMRTKISDRKQWNSDLDNVNHNNSEARLHRGKSSSLPELTMSENLVTGALARGLVGYITMPITVLKVRYESTMYNYTSLYQATGDIFVKEGINGFFKGFGATCLRDAPYAGLYVLLYEKSKMLLPMVMPLSMLKYGSDGNYSTITSTMVNSVSAFTAASIATTITAPFDTIKTRMQLEPLKFRNSLQTFKYMIINENLTRLFSGLSMRLARKAVSAGIAWGIYEEIIKYIANH